MNVISYLIIYNCDVAWSDIDVFEKAFNLRFLELSPRGDILYRNYAHLQKLGELSLIGQFGVTGITTSVT